MDKIDFTGLGHRVEQAASNHFNVRAVLMELLGLVKAAYEPETESKPTPKPPEAVGEPKNVAEVEGDTEVEDDTEVPDPE